MKTNTDLTQEEREILFDLKDNFKYFFRLLSKYEEAKWERYASILIKRIEEHLFKLDDINNEFILELLNKCEISTEDEEVSGLIKEIKDLIFLYFSTKNENLLIEKGSLKYSGLTSSPQKTMWSTKGPIQ